MKSGFWIEIFDNFFLNVLLMSWALFKWSLSTFELLLLLVILFFCWKLFKLIYILQLVDQLQYFLVRTMDKFVIHLIQCFINFVNIIIFIIIILDKIGHVVASSLRLHRRGWLEGDLSSTISCTALSNTTESAGVSILDFFSPSISHLQGQSVRLLSVDCKNKQVS